MAKQMKSFRLPEWTNDKIESMADGLNISQADLVTLAVLAFNEFGIKQALMNADYRANDFASLVTLIDMSARGGSIAYEVESQINACANF